MIYFFIFLLFLSAWLRLTRAVLHTGSAKPAVLDSMFHMHADFDEVLDIIFDGPADVLVGTKASETKTLKLTTPRCIIKYPNISFLFFGSVQPGGRLTVPATRNPVGGIQWINAYIHRFSILLNCCKQNGIVVVVLVNKIVLSGLQSPSPILPSSRRLAA